MMNLLPTMKKQMNVNMTIADNDTMRSVPMPERRSHKRFSKQTMMLSWLVLLVLVVLLLPGQVYAEQSDEARVQGV